MTSSNLGPGAASATTPVSGNGNCDITNVSMNFNSYFWSFYPPEKMQSLAIHEFGHGTGQIRSPDVSEVNDGCSLRTIMQQSDSCRWDTKGINKLTETHDLNDYYTVYGPQ